MSSTRSLLLGDGLLQDAAVGAVIVAENFGLFQELVAREHSLELFPGDEVVALPVAPPRRAAFGWCKRRKTEVRNVTPAGERPAWIYPTRRARR